MMNQVIVFILLLLTHSVCGQSPPSNDECIDATIIPSTFLYIDTIPNFSDATDNINDIVPNCYPDGVESIDVWYYWDPSVTGIYQLATVGSTLTFEGSEFESPFYPLIIIYEGDECGVLQEIECGYYFLPAIDVTAGKSYFVQMKEPIYYNATRKLVFSIEETPPPPPNDECVDAIAIPSSVSFPYSTEPVFLALATGNPNDPIFSCASVPPSSDPPSSSPSSASSDFPSSAPSIIEVDPIYETVWYSFIPPSSDRYDFTTKGSTDIYGSSVYAQIYIFEGSTCDALDTIECGNYQDLRKVSLIAGTKYYIMVLAYGRSSGANLILTVEPTPPPPPNDECINAIDVDPFSGTVFTADTTEASLDDVNDTAFCGVNINAPGTWYKVTNTLPMTLPIIATTCNNGTFYDTQISVFKGNSCDSLTCVGGNDDSCGLSSKVQFVAEAKATYYILVHGFSGSVGKYALTIDIFSEYFALIDSKTDKVIEVLDSFFGYYEVASTSSSLNIEAVFSRNTTIRSVLVTFDDPPISFCENEPPYSVFRDNNGNFRDALIPIGSHEVTATPYGRKSCKGPPGTKLSQTFEVEGCFPFFTLYNSNSNDTEFTGCNFNLEVFPGCAFEVGSILFTVNNTETNTTIVSRTEKEAPFFLFGNIGDKIKYDTIPPGEYVLDMTIDGINHYDLYFSIEDFGPCA